MVSVFCKDDPKAREVGVLGAEALLDSLIVVSVLKPIAGSNRPNAKDDQGNFFDGGACVSIRACHRDLVAGFGDLL